MISKIIRRTHMYLALFLGPWILMYASSTFVMNHRASFRGDPAPPPRWERVSEGVYDGEFPNGAGPEQMARQLLDSLELDGWHQAALRDGKLIVNRFQAARPVRLTYSAADRRLTLERQAWEGAAFLERAHRRRGFETSYFPDNAWALLVDMFIAAVLFWTLSGLWLWWEVRAARRAGALLALAGGALFCILLAAL